MIGRDFGSFYKYVWAAGLIASGQATTMTSTLAGQYIMQGFLNLKMAAWNVTLLTRSVAIMPCIFIVFLDEKHFDTLNEKLNLM